MRSVEVLEQLDAASEEFLFPDLGHGYYYAVDARLHGYWDAWQWALIVETVGYSPRAGNLIDVLHVFGDCLTRGEPGYGYDDFHERVDNWDEIEDPNEPETYRGGPVVVRGQTIAVTAEPGEDLVDVLRLLVPRHRALLLADEGELRRRIRVDIPEVLRLDQWHHPDLAGGLRPSESETFRQIADVLVRQPPFVR
ncbi:hypothetical protein [Micromonospora sp. NPDC051296]|uniref:DUF7003 family protein n=1 Tax=Micromonospora sp. NPDC051296 TaxID=3155046 RepID=UPI0034197571